MLCQVAFGFGHTEIRAAFLEVEYADGEARVFYRLGKSGKFLIESTDLMCRREKSGWHL